MLNEYAIEGSAKERVNELKLKILKWVFQGRVIFFESDGCCTDL